MSRIACLTVSIIALAEVIATHAADTLTGKTAGRLPDGLVGQRSVWTNPKNYLRPHKGVRSELGRNSCSMLLWVLCSPTGQPLAVSPLGETKVNDYFLSRLEARLAEIAEHRVLHPEQIDKLKLAAKVELARLTRLAQRIDDELAKCHIDDERSINKMLHVLASACDQGLFKEESLFNRVLATQLIVGKAANH